MAIYLRLCSMAFRTSILIISVDDSYVLSKFRIRINIGNIEDNNVRGKGA